MPDLMRSVEHKVASIQHGFTLMQNEALDIVKQNSIAENLRIAKTLYSSDKYQVRMVAVFILGFIATSSSASLVFLRKKVSKDTSWQVQEILAKAFDEYCKSLGYEKSLPIIQDWLQDANPNVRRAVTEGLRIWNQRDYFRERPDLAVEILSKLKDDESEYVRKSVGNALRDISKREKELVRKELAAWDLSNQKIKLTYNLASKFLQKS